MLEALEFINKNVLWGVPTIALFLACGVFFTLKLRFGQLLGFGTIMRTTLFSKKKSDDKKNLSPLQTLMAALATTIGTGNIVAVSSAVVIGGAGAVFWMLVSALFSMATCYAENVLGMKYRKRGADGSYFGGPFFYMERAFRSKIIAKIVAALCVLSGFGMGNMTQMNSMAWAVKSAFGIDQRVTGAVAAVIIGFIIFGGVKRLGILSEKAVPVFSGAYIIGCVAIIFTHLGAVPETLSRIFSEAFTVRAGAGGFFGSAMMLSMSWGIRRGIFSNEAGLGSSVMLHCTTTEENPQKQGMWAMLQVFFDTVVMCTLTALAVLSSGADRVALDGGSAAIAAFETVLGGFAAPFIAISLVFFAITTAAGWFVYGQRSLFYLTKGRFNALYALAYIFAVVVGSALRLELVWAIADACNGLMALPNITAVLMLHKEVDCNWEKANE